MAPLTALVDQTEVLPFPSLRLFWAILWLTGGEGLGS